MISMSVKARTRTAKRKHTSTVIPNAFALCAALTVIVAAFWGFAEYGNTKPSIAYLAFLNLGWVEMVLFYLWSRTHRSGVK